MKKHYDVLGIGFGPANIALAIALEELMVGVNAKFIETRERSVWQPEMMLEGSDIQNHPLRDLVTPRNPRSKYTFTNYLFEQERLFEYLNLGITFSLRKEYAQYVEWVAKHFKHWVEYNEHVTSIEIICDDNSKGCGYRVGTKSGKSYTAKAIVVAPGRTPYIPKPFDSVNSERVFHLTKYLTNITRWKQKQNLERIAVIGGSQSAAEIILDLSTRFPKTEIVGFTRSFGYRLKDTSPFTGEVYFPSFVNYYYHANQKSKDQLDQDLRYTNYSAVDGDVINKIYLKIYEQKLDAEQKIFIKKNRHIFDLQLKDRYVSLSVFEKHLNKTEVEKFDLVILATGFRNMGSKEYEEQYPPILKSIKNYLSMNNDNYLHINYDYSLNLSDDISPHAPIFVNGLCESSHGMGDAGSFSLLSLRSKAIVEGLKRRTEKVSSPLNNKNPVTLLPIAKK